MRILLTRPEADAARTAAALSARGHEVVIAPLLGMEFVADADLGAGPWGAILVTSANAARAISIHQRREELRSIAVFAIGQHSAQAMRTAGFANVTSVDGNVTDLAAFVAAQMAPDAPLLYLAAAERAGDLGGALGAQGFAVRTVVVYRAVAAETLPRHASDAVAAGIDAVMHFSRRSAIAFVTAARTSGMLEAALTKPVHYCLSARVAEPLGAAGAADIRIATRPDEAAMLALCN